MSPIRRRQSTRKKKKKPLEGLILLLLLICIGTVIFEMERNHAFRAWARNSIPFCSFIFSAHPTEGGLLNAMFQELASPVTVKHDGLSVQLVALDRELKKYQNGSIAERSYYAACIRTTSLLKQLDKQKTQASYELRTLDSAFRGIEGGRVDAERSRDLKVGAIRSRWESYTQSSTGTRSAYINTTMQRELKVHFNDVTDIGVRIADMQPSSTLQARVPALKDRRKKNLGSI